MNLDDLNCYYSIWIYRGTFTLVRFPLQFSIRIAFFVGQKLFKNSELQMIWN